MISFDILRGKLSRGRAELFHLRMLDVWPLCFLDPALKECEVADTSIILDFDVVFFSFCNSLLFDLTETIYTKKYITTTKENITL